MKRLVILIFLLKFISCTFLISVGDLKYKILLLNDLSIINIAKTDKQRRADKKDTLFLTFFVSIKCFKLFYCKMILPAMQF